MTKTFDDALYEAWIAGIRYFLASEDDEIPFDVWRATLADTPTGDDT